MIDIQNVNIKIFALQPVEIMWPNLIPVFHRWIQNKSLPETLIDVADYAHVPSGPGVMLIAHEAFYSLDNRESHPGLLYNRRMPVDGNLKEKLDQAYDSALAAARLLEQEPEFRDRIAFDPQQCEVFFNDRLFTPNTEETWSLLRPELEQFFLQKFGSAPDLRWIGASRELFRVRVQLASALAFA